MSEKLDQGSEEEQKRAQHTNLGANTASGASTAGSGVSIQAASATPVRTPLGKMTLSMFEKGQYVRVRVGSLHNATELYEHAYDSADEANTALLDAGILTQEDVPDNTRLLGTGIELNEVTAEQLERAGLKKHLSGSL